MFGKEYSVFIIGIWTGLDNFCDNIMGRLGIGNVSLFSPPAPCQLSLEGRLACPPGGLVWIIFIPAEFNILVSFVSFALLASLLISFFWNNFFLSVFFINSSRIFLKTKSFISFINSFTAAGDIPILFSNSFG